MAEQPSVKPLRRQDQLILLIAEGLGLGRIPRMPGTIGSLWGLPLGWILGRCLDTPGRLLVALVMLLIGIPVCRQAARLRNTKDPGSVVWDEIAAFPFVYAFVPVTTTTLVLGFVLFRLFDIVKPPPIRWLEHHVHGGTGIMLDDTLAACWTQIPFLLLVHQAGWM